MMKKIIKRILAILARMIIRKYKPFIIGITGSVGKTSTKEAIFLVLKNSFKLRATYKNYNNEIGLPLTIINAKSAGKSFFGWLGVFLKGIFLVIFPVSFPKVLVLEMAADKPGDIKYLTEIAPCRVGVLTAIGPSHLEKFQTIENVGREKKIMIAHLDVQGWAVLNADDERVYLLKSETKSKVLTYGFSEKADLRALELNLDQGINVRGELELRGLNFKLSYLGSVIPVFLPLIAKHQVYAVLAAAATGLIMNLNLLEISGVLKEFHSLAGRLRVIKGKNNSLIIDDCYNASPQAMIAALETLKELVLLPSWRKWAVLGSMLELGDYSEKAHREVGERVAEMGFDFLVTVGKEADWIEKGAKKRGFSQTNLYHFEKSEEAADFLVEEIRNGDQILIKGSQGVRMEKIVKKLMIETEKANELLVRQEKDWELR